MSTAHYDQFEKQPLIGTFCKIHSLLLIAIMLMAPCFFATHNPRAEEQHFIAEVMSRGSLHQGSAQSQTSQQTASATATAYFFEPVSGIMQFKNSSNITWVDLVDNIAYLNWHSVGRRYAFHEGNAGDFLNLETIKPNGDKVTGEWLWDDDAECWQENWLLGTDCWPPGAVITYLTQSSRHGNWVWREEINGVLQSAWVQNFRVVGLNLDLEGDASFRGWGGSTLATPLQAKLYGNDQPEGVPGWTVRFSMPASLLALGFGLTNTPGGALVTNLAVDSGVDGMARAFVVLGDSEQSFTVSASALVAPIDFRDPPLHLENPSYVISSWMPMPPDADGEGLDEEENLGASGPPHGPCNMVGNPINVITGNKFQREIDVTGNGASGLAFERYYNSKDSGSTSLGIGWRHNFDRTFTITKQGKGKNAVTSAYIKRPDGKAFTLQDTGSGFVGDPEFDFGLVKKSGKWQLSTDQDTIEIYDGKGRLITIVERNGNTKELDYDNQGNLIQISTNSNQFLVFTYGDQGLLATVEYWASNPAPSTQQGRSWHFEYTDDLLTAVTNPDNSQREYHYENTDFPQALTGITDERGMRYASWEYDAYGFAISSYHGVNANRVDVSFDADGERTVTNGAGNVTRYNSIAQHGQGKVRKTKGPTCSTGNNSVAEYTYEPTTGNLVAKTIDGTVTEYGNHDNHGNPGYVVEAVDTPEERRRDYTYDSRFHSKVTRITESSVAAGNEKVTLREYDDSGNLINETINGFRPGGTPVSRTTTYQYDGPYGQISQIDGPRTDVSDITIFEYYADDASLYQHQGMLMRVTGPEGIVLRNNLQYNEFRQLISEERPNGLSLIYEWDEETGRLNSVTESHGSQSRTTSWSYLPTGEMETISYPDGNTLTFTYNAASQLTRVTDFQGNYIEYTLDSEGNVLAESVYGYDNTLHREIVRSFDVYNRLDQVARANELVDYDFSADGTLASEVNGNNVRTDYSYDDLKRLVSTRRDSTGNDPATANSLVGRGYDAQGNLVWITDPKFSQTSYGYDDLGNQVAVVSPDTGTTRHSYDAAGNRVQTVDAKGQVFAFAYDGLNRLLSVNAPGSEHDVDYGYDFCVNGAGKLCSVARGGNTTQYDYNGFGEIIGKTESVLTYSSMVNASLSIDYDAMGRIQSITYPGGVEVDYGYDDLGNPSQLTLYRSGLITDVVNNSSYKPFGPLSAMTLGNGISRTLAYDKAYRLTAINDPIHDAVLSYDANGNIIYMSRSDGDLGAGYDALDKLTDTTGPLGSQAYQYDRNGNRTQLTDNGIPTSYAYSPMSNRLSQINGEAVVMDANGNTLGLPGLGLEYSPDNRLVGVSGIADYAYNGMGERVWKSTAAEETVYLYSPQGQLMAELNDIGQVQKIYLWFNGQPVAMVDNLATSAGVLYYIHTDHLGTPQALTDEFGAEVWRADYKPFGIASVNDDPDMDGAAVEFNFRFPGQYFDEETGLHYNYFRDYDPSTGRYMQGDPIGLLGGLNTYGYVYQNPLIWIDPLGLSRKSRRSEPKSGVISGLGGQMGTTTYGPAGWGQSNSVGIAAYYEICTKEKEGGCDDGEPEPNSSLPDAVGGTWYVLGVVVNIDGTVCTQYGLILTWPPIAPSWNIPGAGEWER